MKTVLAEPDDTCWSCGRAGTETERRPVTGYGTQKVCVDRQSCAAQILADVRNVARKATARQPRPPRTEGIHQP